MSRFQLQYFQDQMQLLNERQCEAHKRKLKVLIELEKCDAYQDLLKVNEEINSVQKEWEMVWMGYSELKIPKLEGYNAKREPDR